MVVPPTMFDPPEGTYAMQGAPPIEAVGEMMRRLLGETPSTVPPPDSAAAPPAGAAPAASDSRRASDVASTSHRLDALSKLDVGASDANRGHPLLGGLDALSLQQVCLGAPSRVAISPGRRSLPLRGWRCARSPARCLFARVALGGGACACLARSSTNACAPQVARFASGRAL